MSGSWKAVDHAFSKVGLALSGGGFRAAFFHVGVLARLAETGWLRRVSAISTVSGGSIVGALYYLHVKNLLEQGPDEIDDACYVRIVRRVEEQFLAGVQTHVRGRAIGDLRKNFRMARANYSRSDRIGELYDEIFYRPAWNDPIWGVPVGGATDGRIELRDLVIEPLPRKQQPPIPQLVINATSLNTGHVWQFTASTLGEPAREEPEWLAVDKNTRLTAVPYGQAGKQSDFELGLAVAASACVPALFPPLAVSSLYRYTRNGTDVHDVRVQLVDGGVHDNQGVCSLVEQGCTVFLVSDASGQLLDVDEPSPRAIPVVQRSSGIYGDRIREEQLSDLDRRGKVALFHLRKGLPAQALSPAPVGADGKATPNSPKLLTPVRYGIDAGVQLALSRVRTDLDSFTEVEAWSLAGLGYRMATKDLDGAEEQADATWQFSAADGQLTNLRPDPEYLFQLRMAKERFFKPLRQLGFGMVVTLGIPALALAALGAVAFAAYGTEVPSLALPIAFFVGVVLAALYLLPTWRWRPVGLVANAIYDHGLPGLTAPFMRVAAEVILRSDPWFVRGGRFEALAGNRRRRRVARTAGLLVPAGIVATAVLAVLYGWIPLAVAGGVVLAGVAVLVGRRLFAEPAPVREPA